MERIKNYINGEWVGSDTKEYGDVWCPATGEKIAEVPLFNGRRRRHGGSRGQCGLRGLEVYASAHESTVSLQVKKLFRGCF